MARTSAFIGAAAILALGGFAALPEDKPRYLGDMPSSLDQPAPAGAPAPRSDPGPAAGGPQAPVQGPSRVVPETPAGGGGAPGERVPAPAADTSRDYRAGVTQGDDSASAPGAPDFLAGLVDAVEGLAGCATSDTVFRPGIGVVDCLTGEILDAVDLPVDPADPLDPLDPLLP
jgi:hypothetical protein